MAVSIFYQLLIQKIMEEDKQVPEKRYSMPELAALYKISERQCRRRRQAIQDKLGPRHGHIFTREQIAIYFKHYGPPAWFAFFINNNEARAAGNYNNVLQSSAGTSSPTFLPVLFVTWLFLQYYHMVYNLKSLIERFIDTPENRRLAMERSKSIRAKVLDVVQINYWIIQVTLAVLATVFAGYWVGTIIISKFLA
jgi:hypothetical protein